MQSQIQVVASFIMTRPPDERFAQFVARRMPIIEPLTLVAAVSLICAWAIQPYAAHALADRGAEVQEAAGAALWLSGVLSPLTALTKALAAALICWSSTPSTVVSDGCIEAPRARLS